MKDRLSPEHLSLVTCMECLKVYKALLQIAQINGQWRLNTNEGILMAGELNLGNRGTISIKHGLVPNGGDPKKVRKTVGELCKVVPLDIINNSLN